MPIFAVASCPLHTIASPTIINPSTLRSKKQKASRAKMTCACEERKKHEMVAWTKRLRKIKKAGEKRALRHQNRAQLILKSMEPMAGEQAQKHVIIALLNIFPTASDAHFQQVLMYVTSRLVVKIWSSPIS